MKYYAIFPFLLFLFGCQASISLEEPRLINENFPTPEVIEITQKSFPSDESIQTALPTLSASPTFLPSPSFTKNYQETISAFEPTEFFEHVLHDDEICELPCWGGITPGVTSWQSAFTALRPLSDLPEDFIFDPSIDPPYRDALLLSPASYSRQMVVTFHYDRAGIIQQIQTLRFKYPFLKLLQSYGKPDAFYIYQDLDISRDPFVRKTALFFFYEQQHFLVVYEYGDEPAQPLAICPKMITGEGESAAIFTWAGEKEFLPFARTYFYNSGLEENVRNITEYFNPEEIDRFYEDLDYCLVITDPWY